MQAFTIELRPLSTNIKENRESELVKMTESPLLGFLEIGAVPPEKPNRHLRQGQAKEDQTTRVLSDSGAVIDVMVVYTQASSDANGGNGQIESMITSGIADANTAYQNRYCLSIEIPRKLSITNVIGKK